MGFKPSPYNAVKSMLMAEEIVRGDPKNCLNPFHWTKVKLNLPGMTDYDPSRSWVCRGFWRDGVWMVASDYSTYIDDGRVMGRDESACRLTTRRVASLLQYLGIQDAARKRRGPKRCPGAWAGALVRSLEEEGIGISVSQEKWDKTRRIIGKWLNEIERSDIKLEHKALERDRGFLVYVARTFRPLRPYLKGIHLTLDSWRKGRDEHGWKDRDYEDLEKDEDWECNLSEKLRNLAVRDAGAPKSVSPVSRLRDDLLALTELTSHDNPPTMLVRPRHKVTVKYGFGDASGAGFGSSISGASGLRIRYGVWGTDNEGRSSNFRELRNLTEALEDNWETGDLHGAEVFVFTDNSTAESAYHRGTSSSQTLFDLVLRLRRMELCAGAKIHIIHVSGTRQISQGSDGLSRGVMTEGVMQGEEITDFVPIHLSAFERTDTALLEWIRDWTDSPDLCPLSPEDWFWKGHDLGSGDHNDDGIWIPQSNASGIHLWAPPPAAARVAVEELRKARHKRQESIHVFVCPRLMCYEWRKMLLKDADMYFYLDPGVLPDVWAKERCEPLLIALCFPFIRTTPWRLAGVPKVLALGKQLRGVFKSGEGNERPILRKLCRLSRDVDRLPPELVRRVLFLGQ